MPIFCLDPPVSDRPTTEHTGTGLAWRARLYAHELRTDPAGARRLRTDPRNITGLRTDPRCKTE